MKKLIVSGLVVAGATLLGGVFLYNTIGGELDTKATMLLGMLSLLSGSVFVVLKTLLDNKE